MSINHYASSSIQPKLDINCKLLKAKNNMSINYLECENLTVDNTLTFNTLSVTGGTVDITNTTAIIPLIAVESAKSNTIESTDFVNLNLVTANILETDDGVYNNNLSRSIVSYQTLSPIVFTPTVNLRLPVVDPLDWRLDITAIERYNNTNSSSVYNIKGNGAYTGATSFEGDYFEFKIDNLNLPIFSNIVSASGFIQSAKSLDYGQYAIQSSLIQNQTIILRYGRIMTQAGEFPANIPVYFTFDIDII